LDQSQRLQNGVVQVGSQLGALLLANACCALEGEVAR
jgi:hypothetical protein